MKKQISGFTHRPSQYELATLAALIKGSYRSSFDSPKSKLTTRAVEEAMDLWQEAGRKLEEAPLSEPLLRLRMNILGRFSEPILVGKHFMPEIPMEFVSLGTCELDHFLFVAIGLTEKTDRMKWFRAFLTGWTEPNKNLVESLIFTRGERYITYLEMSRKRASETLIPSSSELIGNPFSTEPYHAEPESHENLESFKKNGIVEPVAMATAFRAWRLTMKDAQNKAANPYDLEVCIALAKEKFKK